MSKPRLLIVDDEVEIRNSIRFFTERDFDVVEASHGKEALEILKTAPIDLLLSDYNMPCMNGLELLKSMIELNKCIPVILLTGRGTVDLCRSTWALGVCEYLEKPFNPNELIKCLIGALESKDDYSEIRRIRRISKLLYEEPSLILASESYRQFHELCLGRGVSMSTAIGELMSDYLKNNSGNAT
jgi:DNA-binding NtrC family response regulator